MDGVEIHNPYRLFGITSAFNPETVANFQLTAGGFGVAYGDRLSSLLIIDSRPGSRDFQGATALSITDGNVVLEGTTPIWDNGTWLFSARRTYYDVIAGRLQEQNFPFVRRPSASGGLAIRCRPSGHADGPPQRRGRGPRHRRGPSR